MVLKAGYGSKLADIMAAKGNNFLSAQDLYEERVYYKDGVYPLYGPKALDLWYDVPLYGKVDHDGDAVFYSGHYANTLTEEDVSVVSVAPDFVVEAFNAFKQDYKSSSIMNNKHSKATSALHQIKATKGWRSLDDEHRKNFQLFNDFFSLEFLKQNNREQSMVTFHDYAKLFLEAFESMAPDIPITRTGYLLSRHCTNRVSGLMVQIADAPAGDDFVKHRKYIGNGNFNMYRNFARRHGFLLDKNAPWKLIADITSVEMKKYMAASGVSTDDLFEKYYRKSHHYDIQNLKIEMYEFYKQYVQVYPSFQVTTPTRHSTKDCLKARKFITKEEFEERYDMYFWLKFYLHLRTKESNINMSQSQFDSKVRKAQKIFQYKGLTKAVDYINMEIRRFVKRTFVGEGKSPRGHKFIFSSARSYRFITSQELGEAMEGIHALSKFGY